MVADEPELDVEGDVLGEVPHRVVRLGAEDRADLVDPLEDADQLLLVELRALGEVGRPAEVVDREDVGARLGRRLDELRGLDLGEPETVEGVPEATQAGGGELPLGPLGRVPPADRRVVELRRQPGGESRAPELERRCLGRLGQRRDRRLRDLDAPGRLVVGGDRAGHLDGRLLGRDRGAGRQHDLGQTAAVADDEEGHPRQLATAVDPAGQPYRGAGCGSGQVGAQRALGGAGGRAVESHVSSRCDGPWRCGRGQGRGATTPSPDETGLSLSRRTHGRALRSGSRGFVRPHVRRRPAYDATRRRPNHAPRSARDGGDRGGSPAPGAGDPPQSAGKGRPPCPWRGAAQLLDVEIDTARVPTGAGLCA